MQISMVKFQQQTSKVKFYLKFIGTFQFEFSRTRYKSINLLYRKVEGI